MIPGKGTKILHPACHTEHPKEKKKKSNSNKKTLGENDVERGGKGNFRPKGRRNSSRGSQWGRKKAGSVVP